MYIIYSRNYFTEQHAEDIETKLKFFIKLKNVLRVFKVNR